MHATWTQRHNQNGDYILDSSKIIASVGLAESFGGTSSNVSKKVLGPTKAQETKLELARAGMFVAKVAAAAYPKHSKEVGYQGGYQGFNFSFKTTRYCTQPYWHFQIH
jgi:hypothetical protein